MRLFEDQPVTDLEGVLCESHRQVPYYRNDVRGGSGGLECNLKGSNETLSININCFKCHGSKKGGPKVIPYGISALRFLATNEQM